MPKSWSSAARARTWGQDIDKHNRREQRVRRRIRGSGSWGSETAKLFRLEQRRMRQERRDKNPLYKLLMGR